MIYVPLFPVIVSEGYKAPFIGMVLSGQCHVLKQLQVLQSLPDGNQVCMYDIPMYHLYV